MSDISITSFFNEVPHGERELHAYFVLDSDACHESSDEYTLKYILSAVPSRQGELKKPSDFRNIKRMRCFPCSTVFLPGIGIPSIKNTINTYYTTTSTLTVLIKELSHTCYEKKDLQWHFALQGICMNVQQSNGFPQIPSNPYFEWVTSGKCDGRVEFATRITDLPSISITLSDGCTLIPRSKITRVVLLVEFIYDK